MSRTPSRRWTPDELSLLRSQAYSLPVSAIAAALNRSVLAIRTKAAHERLPLQDDLTPSGPRRQPAPWHGARER